VIVDCFRFGARFSSKAALMTASVLYAVIGAILSELGSNDPKACVDLRITSIFGTILTGIGIILSAWASRTNPDETARACDKSDGEDSGLAASGNPSGTGTR
jgi:protein-S-isoprenylcysteine O-methyltransferase Ste14